MALKPWSIFNPEYWTKKYRQTASEAMLAVFKVKLRCSGIS